jgi:HSP20 family protein
MIDTTPSNTSSPTISTQSAQNPHRQVRTPAVNITDSPEAVAIVATMPGVEAKDVEINITGNLLTIRGTLKPMTQTGFTLVHQEYASADFERSFTLSNDLDASKAAASTAHGLVRITLPKVPASQPRRIAVQAL